MAIEQEDPVNAYFRQLREKQAAQEAAQQPQQDQAPEFTGMGDVRGQITGGARSADGSMWNFHDQGGNTLTSMPLQEYYAKHQDPNGGMMQNLGQSFQGVPVWNPLQTAQQPAPQGVGQSRPSPGFGASSGMLNQQPFQWNGAPTTPTAPKPATQFNPAMNNFFSRYWGK